MKFKNISLFSVLLVAGFVGTVARSEFAVELDGTSKLRYKSRELKARQKEFAGVAGCLAMYRNLEDDVADKCHDTKHKNRKKHLPKGSIEVCVYGKEIAASIEEIDAKYRSLFEVITQLNTEISDLGGGTSHDIDYE